MKKKLQTTLVLSITALLLSACSSSLHQFEAQKRTAPTSEQDLGVLVSGADEADIAALLSSKPEARFRVLDKNRGFYEVFNVSQEEVEASVDGFVSSNFWISRQAGLQTEQLQLLAEETEGSTAAAEEDKKLNRCVRDSKSPSVNVTVISPEGGLQDQMEMGLQVDLEGTGQAHPDFPSELRTAFVVVSPVGSVQQELVVFDNKVSFVTDTMGLYQILFIVQDDRNVCGMQEMQVFITGNKDYVGADFNVDEDLAKLKMEDFTHLPELQAEEAWEVGQGEGMVIAVIDSGVNYNHPALLKNIQTNGGEIPGNNVDDDLNGFVDDYVGYDFSNNDWSPYDDGGHGSHVSGLAASSVFGTGKKAKILPIKALGARGGDIGSIAAAIRYAVDQGADILNMSFGAYGAALPEFISAMNYAESKGVLVVAASGNGHPFFGIGLNTDVVPNFPSAFPNSNIVAVAAKAKGHVLAPYSNYGVNSVDIAAPGGVDPDDLLLSCFLETPTRIDYVGMSGTSMATPVVAGIAAQVWAINPDLSAQEVRRILMEAGEVNPELEERVQSSRYINAKMAVDLAKASLSPMALD